MRDISCFDEHAKMKILDGAFTYVEGKSNEVQCQKCAKIFKYHHSTSSLKYHLSTAHGNDKVTSTEEDSATTSDPKQLKLTFTKLTQTKKNAMTNSIAKWIAKDSRPISIVEDMGLLQTYRIALDNNSYELPSRGTISNRVSEMFEREKADIETRLKLAKYISLTSDYWTSTANENYLGLTCHFIDGNFKLNSLVLDVSHSSDRHTSENIAKHIKELSKSWKVDDKLVAMTTDNAPNMVNAVSKLPYSHVGCSAHVLQLAVNKALTTSNVDQAITKLRKIVGHVKHSPANYSELKRLQEANGRPKQALVSKCSVFIFE